MDWRSRSTRKLLGKIVTVQVDRPIGYLHGDILYPVNYGFVPGLMGGDGEEQDAYILGVDTPLSSFTGRVIAVIRRHNDCEDKLVVAPEGLSLHQGQIAQAVRFQEQYFISTIDSVFQKSCGVVPFRRLGGNAEILLLFQRGSGTWSFPKGHMEAGETEQQTALRELFEETGFRTRLIPDAKAATEYRLSSAARKQVVFFLGEVHGEPRLQAKEIESCRWAAPGELEQYLLPQVASAAKALLARI